MRVRTFEDFWPFYLSQHRHPVCQRLHVVGTSLALLLVFGALATRHFGGLLAAPLVGYGCASLGHYYFEEIARGVRPSVVVAAQQLAPVRARLHRAVASRACAARLVVPALGLRHTRLAQNLGQDFAQGFGPIGLWHHAGEAEFFRARHDGVGRITARRNDRHLRVDAV